MQELIQNITAKAGITEQQALVAVNTTKDFIKAKTPPMAAGMIDQFFEGKFDPATIMKSVGSQQSDFMNKAKEMVQETGEKVTEFTHAAIDKSAEFAKEATQHMHEWARQAGGWSEEAMQKVREMFGGQ